MAPPEPRAKNLADLYHLAPLDWADVRRTLEGNLTQEPGTDVGQLIEVEPANLGCLVSVGRRIARFNRGVVDDRHAGGGRSKLAV